ncbi:MAG: hypothetical protein JWQ19_3707 [Subtercola sp.]|nr:hypothetical protein [Subtercola sp.]
MQDEMSTLIAEVYEAAGALRMSGEDIAAQENVTLPQWHVMDAITDPSTTVARAARRMGQSRQAVQKTVNEMVATGLLELHPNPDHKTSPLIALTPSGLEVQQRLWQRAAKSHEVRFGALPQRDLEITRATLRQMTQLTYEVHGPK